MPYVVSKERQWKNWRRSNKRKADASDDVSAFLLFHMVIVAVFNLRLINLVFIFAKVNFKSLRKKHERQEILSLGSRRTIVGGGPLELYGPPDAFYHAGSDEIGHC